MPTLEKSVEYECLDCHQKAKKDPGNEKSEKFKLEAGLEEHKKSKHPKKEK